MTHICVSNLTITGSDNGLSPGRRQAIILTNAGIMLIWTLLRNKFLWNINRNSYIFIQENAFENVVCEMASICLGLSVLNGWKSTSQQIKSDTWQEESQQEKHQKQNQRTSIQIPTFSIFRFIFFDCLLSSNFCDWRAKDCTEKRY